MVYASTQRAVLAIAAIVFVSGCASLPSVPGMPSRDPAPAAEPAPAPVTSEANAAAPAPVQPEPVANGPDDSELRGDLVQTYQDVLSCVSVAAGLLPLAEIYPEFAEVSGYDARTLRFVADTMRDVALDYGVGDLGLAPEKVEQDFYQVHEAFWTGLGYEPGASLAVDDPTYVEIISPIAAKCTDTAIVLSAMADGIASMSDAEVTQALDALGEAEQ